MDLNITQTTNGYQIKSLKWNPVDNIIVGMVKCPLIGRINLHEGYVCCQWKRNGKPTNNFKGREDLTLQITQV